MANPRTLNLEKLSTAKNKITLGFKCSPVLKLQLANEAQELSITLSEYVESIVLNYQTNGRPVNQIKENAALVNQPVNQIETQLTIINSLKSKLQFYENDILKELFLIYRGKTIDFKSAQGDSLKVTISSLQDVYTVFINSFKIAK